MNEKDRWRFASFCATSDDGDGQQLLFAQELAHVACAVAFHDALALLARSIERGVFKCPQRISPSSSPLSLRG